MRPNPPESLICTKHALVRRHHFAVIYLEDGAQSATEFEREAQSSGLTILTKACLADLPIESAQLDHYLDHLLLCRTILIVLTQRSIEEIAIAHEQPSDFFLFVEYALAAHSRYGAKVLVKYTEQTQRQRILDITKIKTGAVPCHRLSLKTLRVFSIAGE